MPRVVTFRCGALLALSAAALLLTARGTVRVQAAPSVGPTRSSPIALTSDNSKLVNVNADTNTVTVFNVAVNPPAKLAEIAVGVDPSSVAVNPNAPKAYVANSFDGTVSVVDLNALRVTNTIVVRSEPMGLALSPNGTRLYVANSSSNLLSVINTAIESVIAEVDLSSAGTAPRAIAVTNDGDADDTDETIFVAMFFGQLRPGKSSVDEGQDDQREGRVIAISATLSLPGAPNPVVLAPIANAGFNSNGKLVPANDVFPAVPSTNPQTFTTATGAFPNQLASIAIHPTTGRGYVVSTGASPNGPFRFNHMAQGLVSVFNTSTRTQITAPQTDPSVRRTAPLNLNQGVELATTPAPRLFMTNPVAMAWRPDGSDAWVIVQNSDLIVRLTVDASGIPTVGSPLLAGPSQIVRADLLSVGGSDLAGKAPRGIAINSTGTRAFVSNFVSRSVTVVDISNPTAPAIIGTAASSPQPPPGSEDATIQLGAELFYTGRGPDGRMSSQSWGACVVCHPQGRSDNVTWMFDAGPRQTTPLDGTNGNTGAQRILNWSAVRDEIHDFELNTRGVFGGRGLIDDDRLFLAMFGASGATPSDSGLFEQFHQLTGVVGTTNDLAGDANLPQVGNGRRDVAVATLDDGRVFIIGGRVGAGQGSVVTGPVSVFEFNPRLNILQTRSSAGFTPRHSLGAAAVKTSGGVRIFAIGGYASTSAIDPPSNLVEEFDPATNTWRTVAPLPTAVAQFGITTAGGVNTAEALRLIHVVSGNIGSESTPVLAMSPGRVQRFQADPIGPGIWSSFSVTSLTPRRNHGAATVLRGVASRVFVIGGQDAAGTVLSTVEEYTNQATPAFVAIPHTSLPAPRARFGIGATVSSNQIYVAGGIDGTGTDQTAVFEYTVANNGPVAGPPGTPSGSWVARGNLSVARRGLALSTPPGITNFLPTRSGGRDARQDAISLFVSRSIRAARAPVASTNPMAIAGQTRFNTDGLTIPAFSCATCHSGARFTKSVVDYPAPPSPDIGIGLGNERVIGAELRQTTTQGSTSVLLNVGTFAPNTAGGRVNEIRFNPADVSHGINPLGANGYNIPSLLSVHETVPYFHSGLAQTLEQVLDGSQDANGVMRHHFVTDPGMRAELVAYLRSIGPIAMPPPTVVTGAANSVTLTGATLNGTANPNGTATTGHFEYGLTTSYGLTTATQVLGSGNAAVAIGGGGITGLSCGTLYHFRARAANAGGTTLGSDATFTTSAALCGFTDPTLTPGATVVKAVHVTELRLHIDQLRARFGLGAFGWTDPSLAAGTTVIRRQHIIDLRTALQGVYVAAAQTPPAYTDPALAPGTTIKGVHIAELRAAVVAIE